MRILIFFKILSRQLKQLYDEALVPICASCMFGQVHRKPWKAKSKTNEIRDDKDQELGNGTLTNHFVSNQPGLVLQISGNLTSQRTTGTTVNVDHILNCLYMHLTCTLSGEETLESKRAYKQVVAKHGVTVKRYHSDNGHFVEKSICNACKSQWRHISFCGVGAHHQNDITKNQIKQLTLKSCTMLLHAKQHWPEYITAIL
eukprot:15364522-Ditylum_brightwellii.AAC.3